ncbi:MAG: FxsA family protein [Actinomycetota bacterium]
MFRFLLLAFVVVPIIEIWVLIQVGAVLGGVETIGLMILVSAIGAYLVRREGFGLMSRIQQRLGAGEVPTKELVDGLLVAMAGALMLTPGFVTDAIGLLCLFPPTRAIIRTALIARYRDRIQVAGPGGAMGGAAGGFGPGFHTPGGPAGGPGQRRPGAGFDDVIDVGDVDYERPEDPPELES